jgi:hypothetical protein
LSARIEGLGGDPNAIPPSPEGAPATKDAGKKEHAAFTGKVIEVVYNCFGDLEAFVLGDCCTPRVFRTRERAIGEIALRACRERMLVTVHVKKDEREREECIQRLVIKC